MPAELHRPATAAPPTQGAMASANAAPNAWDDHSRDIFEFFELPRELRDVIYGYCLTDNAPRSFGGTLFERQNREAAHPDLLVLCRQFAREYQSIAGKTTTLHIFDVIREVPRSNEIAPLSGPALRTSSLVLHLATDEDWQGDYDTRCHKQWIIGFLTTLPRLRKLTVIIHTPMYSTSEVEMLKVDLASWLLLPMLQKLEVYDTCQDLEVLRSIEGYEKWTKENLLAARWTMTEGGWEDVLERDFDVDPSEDEYDIDKEDNGDFDENHDEYDDGDDDGDE